MRNGKNTHMAKRLAALVLAGILSVAAAGCGSGSGAKAAAVQSVAMLAGLTDVMQAQTFAGVVSTGMEESIKRDTSRRISKVYVKAEDVVEAGDVLFTYDAEQAQNNLEKAKLELEELNNTLTSKEKEKEQLETEKAKAKADVQLDYTLKIQETDTEIRETQYNITLKEKEIQSLEATTQNLDVTAPFAGKIESAGEADASSTDVFGNDTDTSTYNSGTYSSDSDSSNDAFIKLVEIGNYRIKGTINEQNRDQVGVGDLMKIYSRTDDSLSWSGYVTEIDFTSAIKTDDSYYGYDSSDEMTSSSKYPFYVSIEDLDGLIVGQHVYMRVDDGQEESDGQIRLASGYINDIETDPWIWAEDANGKLEKRSVTLGEYDSEKDTYVIESGLAETDYIAYPNADYTVGMECAENDESAFGTDSDVEDYEFEYDFDDEYEDEYDIPDAGVYYGDEEEYDFDETDVIDDFDEYEDGTGVVGEAAFDIDENGIADDTGIVGDDDETYIEDETGVIEDDAAYDLIYDEEINGAMDGGAVG